MRWTVILVQKRISIKMYWKWFYYKNALKIIYFENELKGFLIGWLVGFTAYQPFSAHLTPNYISNNLVLYKYCFSLQTVKCQNSSVKY